MIELLLRVTRVISPSRFMTRTSSAEVFPLLLNEDVVEVTESVNCLGVKEPVLERVSIFRVSRAEIN